MKRNKYFTSVHLGKVARITSSDYSENKKLWEELIAYFPLVPHRPHSKRSVQNSSAAACVVVAGVMTTVPLPSNNKGICIRTPTLMGRISEVCR
jgi:hypothetical protein